MKKAIVIGIMSQELVRERILSKPQSITSLAEITGRKTSNLSRTLKTMSNYGFVEMQREKNHVRPVVNTTDFMIVA